MTSLLPLFAILLTLQCGLIVGHDLIDLRGWHHGSQVRAAVGTKKFWLGTLSTAVFPAIACFFALRFWHQSVPGYVANYWWIYCAITVASAIGMWWVPYFFGAKAETKRLYAAMYAGTRHWIPARGDNPRPNALHLIFHGLFLINLVLALGFRFG